MIRMISEPNASNLVGSYYDLLIRTGYVKPRIIKAFIFYLFILDFVEYMHAFIGADEYKIIDKALSRLFANGGCLFEYPVFCEKRITMRTDRAILSRREPFDGYRIRITESDIAQPNDENNLVTVEV